MAVILVVDDSANHRALIEQELKDDGYTVVVAFNNVEALGFMSKIRPDLVVTDIAMPGADGIDLLQDILVHDRTIPVILYSGYSEYERVFMAWAADAYVLKSGDLTELKTTIARLLTERSAPCAPHAILRR